MHLNVTNNRSEFQLSKGSWNFVPTTRRISSLAHAIANFIFGGFVFFTCVLIWMKKNVVQLIEMVQCSLVGLFTRNSFTISTCVVSSLSSMFACSETFVKEWLTFGPWKVQLAAPLKRQGTPRTLSHFELVYSWWELKATFSSCFIALISVKEYFVVHRLPVKRTETLAYSRKNSLIQDY